MLIEFAEEQKLDVKGMINARRSADDSPSLPCAHILIEEQSSQSAKAELLEFLLDKGLVDENVRDSKGNTPLHAACQHHADQCVRLLLKSKRTKVNAQNNFRQSPLCVATSIDYHKDTKVIEALLAHPRVKVNWRDRFGSTPLHGAARKARANIVKVPQLSCFYCALLSFVKIDPF